MATAQWGTSVSLVMHWGDDNNEDERDDANKDEDGLVVLESKYQPVPPSTNLVSLWSS